MKTNQFIPNKFTQTLIIMKKEKNYILQTLGQGYLNKETINTNDI